MPMSLIQHKLINLKSPSTVTGLYAITTSRPQTTSQLISAVNCAIHGGALTIQYRNKSKDQKLRYAQAQAIRALCQQHNVIFIINDDALLARQVQADGVHLGRNDTTLAAARKILGKQAIIGVSCYNQLDLAIQAEQLGADYVAFGSFYPSATKPQAVIAELPLLKQARQTLSMPIVAIGGITLDNGGQLIKAGASALAIISGLFDLPVNNNKAEPEITTAARKYTRLFNL